jgi:hypothetical protein
MLYRGGKLPDVSLQDLTHDTCQRSPSLMLKRSAIALGMVTWSLLVTLLMSAL